MTITLVGNGFSSGIKYFAFNISMEMKMGKEQILYHLKKAYSILCLMMVCGKLNVPPKKFICRFDLELIAKTFQIYFLNHNT